MPGALHIACKGFAETGGGVDKGGRRNGAQTGQRRARAAKNVKDYERRPAQPMAVIEHSQAGQIGARRRADESRGGDAARIAHW